MSDPPERRPPSSLEIDVAVLAAERGANCDIVGLAAVKCPRCGSRDTNWIRTPPHRDTTWLSHGAFRRGERNESSYFSAGVRLRSSAPAIPRPASTVQSRYKSSPSR